MDERRRRQLEWYLRSALAIATSSSTSYTHGPDNIGASGLTAPTLTNTGGTTTGLLTFSLSGLYSPTVGDTLTLTINGVDYASIPNPLDATAVYDLSAVFDTPTLNNGTYTIWVKHGRGANYVYSNTILVTVARPSVAPTVSIDLIISGGGTVGDIATATPAVINAGYYPTSLTRSYQWKVDGVNVGTNSVNYTTTTAGALTCVETISNGVAPDATSTSNTITTTAENSIQWEDATNFDWEDGTAAIWE